MRRNAYVFKIEKLQHEISFGILCALLRLNKNDIFNVKVILNSYNEDSYEYINDFCKYIKSESFVDSILHSANKNKIDAQTLIINFLMKNIKLIKEKKTNCDLVIEVNNGNELSQELNKVEQIIKSINNLLYEYSIEDGKTKWAVFKYLSWRRIINNDQISSLLLLHNHFQSTFFRQAYQSILNDTNINIYLWLSDKLDLIDSVFDFEIVEDPSTELSKHLADFNGLFTKVLDNKQSDSTLHDSLDEIKNKIDKYSLLNVNKFDEVLHKIDMVPKTILDKFSDLDRKIDSIIDGHNKEDILETLDRKLTQISEYIQEKCDKIEVPEKNLYMLAFLNTEQIKKNLDTIIEIISLDKYKTEYNKRFVENNSMFYEVDFSGGHMLLYAKNAKIIIEYLDLIDLQNNKCINYLKNNNILYHINIYRDTEIFDEFKKVISSVDNNLYIISPWANEYVLGKYENYLKKAVDNKKVNIYIKYGIEDKSLKFETNIGTAESRNEKTLRSLLNLQNKVGKNHVHLEEDNTHVKLIIKDDNYCLIGSCNIFSFYGNYKERECRQEILVGIRDPKFIKTLKEMYFNRK